MRLVAPQKQITPDANPITMAPIGPTLPEAGVMATRPATAPVTMPKTLGLPCLIYSTAIQAIAAVAVENCVISMAIPAAPSAATALPALDLNQPTHDIGSADNGYG